MITFTAEFGRPEGWFYQARHQFAAAELLIQEVKSRQEPPLSDLDVRVGCLDAGLLLIGLAAENALKGLIVSQKAPEIRNGKVDRESLFGKGMKAHDLRALSTRTPMQPSDDQLELMDRLTQLVVWAGRYNLPLSEREFERAQQHNPRRLSYPDDLQAVQALIDEAQELAYS